MARMLPETLDEVASEAERRLFDVFRDDFSDDWTVLHGVRWLARDRRGARDGEADFVVAHPRYGVLVLEVKGGGIERDATTGKWTSRDRDGTAHAIKDPFKQAMTSMHALRSKLKESPLTAGFAYPLAYGVAFPDIWVEADFGADAPRQIILDVPRIRDLKQSVVDIFRYHAGEVRAEPLPEGALDGLVGVLGVSRQIEATIAGGMERAERMIRNLTHEQFNLLDVIRGHRRALVRGCAGSGKTMLAMEKARRLAADGYRVLLTCYNQNLGAWLAEQMKGTGVDVYHFHRLCAQMAGKAGIDLARRPDEPDEEFFNQRQPAALLDAAFALPDRYDAIIVDEGQDFAPEWWVPLQALLADPDDGILYIFFDDNQRLYARELDFPVKTPPFVLSRNCRNTRQIHEAVMVFYESDSPPECIGPDGEKPLLHRLETGADERREVEGLIESLITEHHRQPGDIAVLSRHGRQHSALNPPPRGSGWEATWELRDCDGKVICSSIHGFKGLERPAVIVCELGDLSPLEQASLLYVAFSRARLYLAVIGWSGLEA